VSVEAFLLSGDAGAPEDIRLNVFDGSGTLQPAPIVIAKGQFSGRSVLTSKYSGPVTVEFLGSVPATAYQGEKKLVIPFAGDHATGSEGESAGDFAGGRTRSWWLR
jgi:hypothetical protein